MAALDPFHHVRDYPYFELPFGNYIELPRILGVQLTKFMVLQVLAAIAAFVIFWGLSRKVRGGEPVRGRWWGFWELLAVFIRDEVVRPTIGDPNHDHHAHIDAEGHHHPEHEGYADFLSGGESVDPHAVGRKAELPRGSHPSDRYLPFVWSCFFYILFCNLLGAFPWMGSATGEINVTGALALVTFGTVLVFGAKEKGALGFWKGLVPGMDVPGPAPVRLLLVGMVWVIEFFGLLIKHGVLAVRLFANIMAGHTVVAMILAFIATAAYSEYSSWLYPLVTPASIVGQVGIGLLELFVAFLQAYIFAFLATLFIATAIHEH